MTNNYACRVIAQGCNKSSPNKPENKIRKSWQKEIFPGKTIFYSSSVFLLQFFVTNGSTRNRQ